MKRFFLRLLDALFAFVTLLLWLLGIFCAIGVLVFLVLAILGVIQGIPFEVKSIAAIIVFALLTVIFLRLAIWCGDFSDRFGKKIKEDPEEERKANLLGWILTIILIIVAAMAFLGTVR